MGVTLKGKEVSIRGTFLQGGASAPEFTLVDKDLNDVTLSSLKGKKVLSIVPSLDTSVCLLSTQKLNALAKKHPEVTFCIISADLPFAQARICTGENLKNIKTLSMMRDQKFGEDYGVLIESGPLKGICCRAILCLDENNQVLHAEQVSEISNEPDYEKMKQALKL